MRRVLVTLVAAVMAVFGPGAGAALAQLPALPEGSVALPEFPEIEPVPMMVPPGSSVVELPPLPFPLFWDEPGPPPPVPSVPEYRGTPVVMWTACPAAFEYAYTADGTQAWCARRQSTDARHWAPEPHAFAYAEATDHSQMSRVEGSLGGTPCTREGESRPNPPTGQIAYCEMRMLGHGGLVWTFPPPPGTNQ